MAHLLRISLLVLTLSLFNFGSSMIIKDIKLFNRTTPDVPLSENEKQPGAVLSEQKSVIIEVDVHMGNAEQNVNNGPGAGAHSSVDEKRENKTVKLGERETPSSEDRKGEVFARDYGFKPHWQKQIVPVEQYLIHSTENKHDRK